MKIRSITYFCDPGWPLDEKILRLAGAFAAEAKAEFEQAGYEVQTTRLATVPFPQLLKDVAALSRLLDETGIAYASLGPALPGIPGSYGVIPEAIAASKNIFFSAVMADEKRGISIPAVKACAQIIVRSASLEANGFANLNFAALANVPPGAPFFPAAYHAGDQPEFALAMEAADVAVSAFSGAKTIEEGRAALVASLEEHAHRLVKVTDFLKEVRSIGAAIERMGVPTAGLHGSLAAAAVLTESVERARFPRAGFSGLFLPVLEDEVLAKRAADGALSVNDLLLYCAVCGTGLDCIPLPGDVSADQLTPLLLDLCALALRLEKPLTARLMPVPGKKAGDPTNFDFGYFANSRVMGLKALPLGAPFSSDQTFSLHPRRHAHD
jgi:uncharacterized protein (UPF0210 family)